MPKKRETTLWTNLRTKYKNWLSLNKDNEYICVFERIENSVGSGMPDLIMCLEGKLFMVEGKASDYVSLNAKPRIDFRDSQIEKLTTWHNAGTKCFIFLLVGNARDKEIFVIPFYELSVLKTLKWGVLLNDYAKWKLPRQWKMSDLINLLNQEYNHSKIVGST
jgi:hypothetical protein